MENTVKEGERVLIASLPEYKEKQVHICGWVSVRRDQGKMVFFVVRDRSASVQAICLPDTPEVVALAQTIRPESSIEITGIVKERPNKNADPSDKLAFLEIAVETLTVLNMAATLPFELDVETKLETALDYRPLTLKSKRARDIFSVAATIVQSYRWALITRDFTEFQAPALVGSDAEGGAEVFKVEYFDNRTANLATSPQLYKEIVTGAFERAFTIAKIFRAEKSATTRHLAEITQMDFEMAFIKDHNDVMDVLEAVTREVCLSVAEKHKQVFVEWNVPLPALPAKPYPRLTLRQAQEILKTEFNIDALGELDMEPEHERKICEWALKEHGSDFVFITEFPTKKRAFYTYPKPEEPEFSRSFDLLFRGLEINSGSQRFHKYDEMVSEMKARGLDESKFNFYLMMHEYGVPPHGGCSTGLERFTARMLELPNVKEAVPFPRDMHRIDTLLSTEE